MLIRGKKQSSVQGALRRRVEDDKEEERIAGPWSEESWKRCPKTRIHQCLLPLALFRLATFDTEVHGSGTQAFLFITLTSAIDRWKKENQTFSTRLVI